MTDAFKQMNIYLKDMALAAQGISEGDLTVQVTARSEQDVLGQAFIKMIKDLNQIFANTTAAVNRLKSIRSRAFEQRGAGRARLRSDHIDNSANCNRHLTANPRY